MTNYIARGRQVVLPLTNKSAGSVAAGDTVILSSGTAAAFTTTTSAGQTDDFVGVVYDATIAQDAIGLVVVQGFVPLITLSSSASLGDYVKTHSVAKQSAPSGTRGSGSFGQVLGTGTTPAAFIWGFPDPATAAGNVASDAIWDAAGDLVQGTGANTAARLAIGTANQMLRVNSGATAVEWSGPLVSAKYKKTSNTTTTSTTMVDADGTNWAFTLTTGAHRCMVGFVGTVINSAANDISALDVSIDGTDQGDATYGLTFWRDSGGNNVNLSFTYLTDVLSAASHTFKLRMAAVGGGTMTINGTGPSALFWVAETLLT